MSLWEKCVELNDRIMVMEHDPVFKNKFEDYHYDGILNLGRPNWGSRVWDGEWGLVESKNCDKVHNPHDPNSRFHFSQESCQCDSKWLLVHHTYIITPRAKILIEDFTKKWNLSQTFLLELICKHLQDQLPHSTVQESDLIYTKKPHNTELKSSNDSAELKKVIVGLSDKNYIKHFTSLVKSQKGLKEMGRRLCFNYERRR